jgi:hypothetical protein
LRLLPAWLVVYSLLMLCLNPDASYQEVMQRMVLGASTSKRWQVPNKSALIQARVRLGNAPAHVRDRRQPGFRQLVIEEQGPALLDQLDDSVEFSRRSPGRGCRGRG